MQESDGYAESAGVRAQHQACVGMESTVRASVATVGVHETAESAVR